MVTDPNPARGTRWLCPTRNHIRRGGAEPVTATAPFLVTELGGPPRSGEKVYSGGNFFRYSELLCEKTLTWVLCTHREGLLSRLDLLSSRI